jgi:hypothetical protein
MPKQRMFRTPLASEIYYNVGAVTDQYNCHQQDTLNLEKSEDA